MGPASQKNLKEVLDKVHKPKPAAKPKGAIYRVIIEGKQVGAYAQNDNALAEARKAIAKGAKNIKIEKV